MSPEDTHFDHLRTTPKASQGQGQAAAAKTVEKMYKNNGRLATINSCCLVSRIFLLLQSSIYAHCAYAIWLHLADTQLYEIGAKAGINYRERHSY
ncbi:hypothetical protein B0H19DRAFT_1366735 [Mycena capillaripes]|nr:hypothetical protein B0H19DRAFT_1366735 [Mycena capillaripes]